MKEEKCKECNVQHSCNYLKHRFKTKNKKCGYDEIQVELMHDSELERRYKLIGEGEVDGR